jgi:hypothetical protein
MLQQFSLNTILQKKIYYYYVISTKHNKHIMLKEVPEQIYSMMYVGLFLFFLISMFLLSLTFVFEVWNVKNNHIIKMARINKELSKKGLSYVEKTWFFQDHVEITDWSECLFLQLPGIIWLMGTLWIIYSVLDQEEYYARKFSKFIIFDPENCLTDKRLTEK